MSGLLTTIMPRRPHPGTPEEDLYERLLVQQSRAGRRVDFELCAELAFLIQEHGHRASKVRYMARDLGLDPRWLPRRRTTWGARKL